MAVACTAAAKQLGLLLTVDTTAATAHPQPATGVAPQPSPAATQLAPIVPSQPSPAVPSQPATAIAAQRSALSTRLWAGEPVANDDHRQLTGSLVLGC